jgi:hypothetical protein
MIAMDENYFSFLDKRAAQRRLAARFSRPRWLWLNTLLFVMVMTLIWEYGITTRIALNRNFYDAPVFIGVIWSVVLGLHGVLHYRRSAAVTEKRELAVEDEMRQFIEHHGADADQASLFEMHHSLEGELQRQSRWSLGLMAFGLVNAASWLVSALNVGSSWPFQTTWAFAIAVIGGVSAFKVWQRQRQLEQRNWFTRLPLSHIFAFCLGGIGLGLLGVFRLINSWDAENLIWLWLMIVILHILVAEIALPVFNRVKRFVWRDPTEKRKPAVPLELVIGDDGEVFNVMEQDVKQYQARKL